MALILTEIIPYSLVLWGDTTRHPRLNQRVSYAQESVDRVNQFLMIVG